MLWRSGLPFAPAGWLPQVGLSAGEPAWLAVSSGTPAVLALAQSREQSRIVNDLFSPAALSLLGRVADGTLEMLVGDDVIAGTPFGVPVLPVVLVRPGTNIVAAALRVSDVGVDQFASKDTSPAADPPDPRAYDALHGTLYSLYAGGSVATLTATDVRSSLAGSQTATTTPVTGATPSDAIAMAWDGIDNVLFVVDSIASSRGHAMRLLRISPSGESAELWRLKSTRQLPRVTLSVSVRNEVVLGVVSEHRTDIAVLSRFGYALQSTSVEGILSGPALGIRQGLAVPLERRPHGSNSNLALSLISSTDLSPMLCGTRWLRRHVDRSTVTPLGQPRLDCGPPHADDDDENDDD